MIATANASHLQAINDIYNQAVNDGFRTAHTSATDLGHRRKWLEHHPPESYPVFVYLDKQQLLGWISVSPYRRGRQALDEIVEVSYYVDFERHGEGIATRLMEHAIEFCQKHDYRMMVAILVGGNEASLRLLDRFSFREGGRIPDAVRYDDEFRDHLYYYKKLG